MIRVLLFLVIVGALALGLGWVADQPGEVSVVFGAKQYQSTPLVALVVVLALALLAALAVALLGFLFRVPSRLRSRARERRRSHGLEALSRGMIAAGAGDLRQARRASADASRHLPDQPLTLLLEAQTALLAGDRDATERTFARIAENPQTRVLGLRGLHLEAQRRGDAVAAHGLAETAHKIAPLPWAAQAVLEHHSGNGDWRQALLTVDANQAQKVIDKTTANRQRAVLNAAIAIDLDRDAREPDQALRFASHAVTLAPDLTPAAALVGKLLARRGDLRKGSRILEAAWRLQPHPELARVYLDLRPGDSSADRLKRAKALAALVPKDPESRLTVAQAAIAAREFGVAREAIEPLANGADGKSPTARVCATMANLEEAENGGSGRVREWLARAARAPRDKSWIADGVISDTWSPVSPVTGKLDAWHWQTPPERFSQLWDPRHDPIVEPAPPPPPAVEIPAPPARLEFDRPSDIATGLLHAPDDPGTVKA